MPPRGVMPGLIELGKIKIGKKGEMVVSKNKKEFRQPEKFDHFIITTNERDETDNYILNEELMDSLRKSDGVVDKNSNLVGIPIRLLYNNVDLVFPTKFSSFVGGKEVCHSLDGKKAKTRDGRIIDCPCDRISSNYEGKEKCKIVGTLNCIIEGSYFGGCYKFRTTGNSIEGRNNSVTNILGSLLSIKAATGGMLAFLPFRLIVQPKKTIIPKTGQVITAYIASIIYPGQIEEMQMKALEMAKGLKSQAMLSMDIIESEAKEYGIIDDYDEAEMQAEFFPDAIDVNSIDVTPNPAEKKSDTETKKEPEPPMEPEKEPEQEPEQEPEKEPIKEPEDVKSETTKPEKPESKPDEVDPPVTIKQKQEMVALKNKKKISNPETWKALLKPFGVKTANKLTMKQADEFIEVLKTNPF